MLFARLLATSTLLHNQHFHDFNIHKASTSFTRAIAATHNIYGLGSIGILYDVSLHVNKGQKARNLALLVILSSNSHVVVAECVRYKNYYLHRLVAVKAPLT